MGGFRFETALAEGCAMSRDCRAGHGTEPPSRPDTELDRRALARARHPGADDQHAERDVDVDVLQVVGAGLAHLQHPDGLRTEGFREARSSRAAR